jgi:RimJ/RimL family protein N-acetyltransferase
VLKEVWTRFVREAVHGRHDNRRVQLETERLLLRPPTLDDLDGFAAIFADAEVTRWLGMPRPRTRQEVETSLRRVISRWAKGEPSLCAVVRKEDEAIVGRVGFLVWDAGRWIHTLLEEPQGATETEIGWAVAREFWGNGYATEAARACRDYAFGKLDLPRVISLIQLGNTRSERVAEKLGERPGELAESPRFANPTRIWTLER